MICGALPGSHKSQTMRIADYSIIAANDLHVVIVDNDGPLSPSVTNSASEVIADLDAKLLGGLRQRRVFYRDTAARFDELCHEAGVFKRFAPCSAGQQQFLQELLAQQLTPAGA